MMSDNLVNRLRENSDLLRLMLRVFTFADPRVKATIEQAVENQQDGRGRIEELEAEADRLRVGLDTTSANLIRAEAEAKRLREALTPSADTKAAYMSEFKVGVRLRHPKTGGEDHRAIDVPWTTIKEIMAAIRARAALNETN